MKKFLFIIAAFVAATFASCRQETVETAVQQDEIAVVLEDELAEFPVVIYASVEGDDDTKAGMDRYYDDGTSSYKYRHHWQTGDVIYVYHGTSRATYTCTNPSIGEFTIGASEGVGKTFTQYRAVYCTVGDLSASADDKVSVSFTGGYTTASDTPGYGNYMVASSSDGAHFKFLSLVGWVKLQLKGTKTITSVRVAKYGEGEDYEGSLNYDFSTETYNYTASQGESIDVTLTIPVTLNESTATDIYIALPAMSYSGMPFEISCSEGGSAHLSTAKTVVVERNKVTPMAVYTATPITLGESEQANCYMVSTRKDAGLHHFRFPTKYVNGTSVVGIKSAKVIWETQNAIQEGVSSMLEAGTVVSDVYYSDGYIYFYRKSKGNALIAAYDGENGTGNILWSWHIWVDTATEAAMNATTTIGGVNFMYSELGKISGEDYGLSYQWGRKDPFYRSGASVPSFKSTLDLALYGNNSYTTQANVTKNPYHYYTGYGNGGYWDSGKDLTRWASVKTNFDPCPPGWKVPEKNSLDALVGSVKTGFNMLTGDLAWAVGMLIAGNNYNGCYLHSTAYLESGNYRISAFDVSGANFAYRTMPLGVAGAVRCQKK